MDIKVYTTFKDLYGRHPNLDELTAIVSKWTRRQAISLCVALNSAFRSKQLARTNELDFFNFWFREVCLDKNTKRLLNESAENKFISQPICHPHTLLNIVKLALDVGRSDVDPQSEGFLNGEQIGLACLMVNDLFCSPAELQQISSGPDDARRAHIVRQMLATFELSNLTPIPNLIFRSYYIYRIALNDGALKARIFSEQKTDFEKEFQEIVGISIYNWIRAALYTHQSLLDTASKQSLYNLKVPVIKRQTYLTLLGLTQREIESFLNTFSTTTDNLREQFSTFINVDQRYDLLPFMSKPLLQFDTDTFTAFDISLVSESINNGPFFLLTKSVADSERQRIFNAWGMLFHSYVEWLLLGLDNRHGARLFTDTYLEKTKKKSKQRSFDAVFIKGQLLIVIESKGGFLKRDARYSSESTALLDDVSKKFGRGCWQLARDIGEIFPHNQKGRALDGIDIPDEISMILPILIVQDNALRTPFINNILNQNFKSDLITSKISDNIEVLPLNVLHIMTMEGLIHMAEGGDVDILAELYKRSRFDSTMASELQTYVSNLPESQEPFRSPRLTNLFKSAMKELFPNSSNEIENDS